jgi:cytochrome c-type biogenesis protein CcmH/NrfG
MKKSFGRQMTLLIALSALTVVMTVAAGVMHPAHAVFSGDMSPKARSGDADYADGMDAWDAKNWDGVVVAMRKVVVRRPWHDKAWTRLGFAFRKLNRLDESLEAYGKALAINPEQREALEYLGEAYLMLDRLSDAQTMLSRLDAECKRVVLIFTDGFFRNACGEHAQLKEKIEAYVTHGKASSPW